MRSFLLFMISGEQIDVAIATENAQIVVYNTLIEKQSVDLDIIVSTLFSIIDTYSTKYNVSGIAISTAGQVDSKNGRILYASEHIANYTGYPMKAILEARYNIPVQVENDVNCSALAESWIGSAKSAKSLFYLSIGMGIGGGYVLENSLISGNSFSAGEIGYLRVNNTELEKLISMDSLFHQFDTKIQQKEKWDLDQIIASYTAGNEVAYTIVEEYIQVLAQAISTICYMLNPEIISIGGKVKGYREFFLPKIKAAVKLLVIPILYEHTSIDISEKIQHSRMIGALRHFLLSETKIPEQEFYIKLSLKKNVLTLREREISEYILSNMDKIPQLTITEMANNLNISEPTITRFCKKIEIGSFQDLKNTLQEISMVKTKYPVVNKYFGNMYLQYNQVFVDLDREQNEQVITAFAHAVNKEKKVYIICEQEQFTQVSILAQKCIEKHIHAEIGIGTQLIGKGMLAPDVPVLCLGVQSFDEQVLSALQKHTCLVISSNEKILQAFTSGTIGLTSAGTFIDNAVFSFLLAVLTSVIEEE